MPDREKVIQSLRRCIYDPDPGQTKKEFISCGECAYHHGCTHDLMRDALALLKDQEPCDEVKGIMAIPAADVEPKIRWIPVTERLPVGGDDSGDICENVCLMLDDGTVSCGWMNGTTKKVYYLNTRDDYVIKAPITRVTHWMPLPEPPKEEEDNDEKPV